MLEPVGLTHYLVLSGWLFACGVLCALTRRSRAGGVAGVVLMMNAAAVNFAALAGFNPTFAVEGRVVVLFVIALNAAEVALGLTVALGLSRRGGAGDPPTGEGEE